MTTWKDIKGYEGAYQVSDNGEVKSLERIVSNGKGFRTVKERIMRSFPDKDGYLQLQIHKSGVYTTPNVHKLVQAAFNLSKGEIDHINRIKQDNRLSNLRVCTKSQNGMNKKSQKGGSSRYKGVSWNKDKKKWVASIMEDGKSYHLGYFADEEDAARVYNEMAGNIFGQFAYLNLVTCPRI